jgi:plasmid maintenance system antidote protein VapI
MRYRIIPSAIADKITEFYENHGTRGAGKLIGISAGQISKIINGRLQVQPATMARLEKWFEGVKIEKN